MSEPTQITTLQIPLVVPEGAEYITLDSDGTLLAWTGEPKRNVYEDGSVRWWYPDGPVHIDLWELQCEWGLGPEWDNDRPETQKVTKATPKHTPSIWAVAIFGTTRTIQPKPERPT